MKTYSFLVVYFLLWHSPLSAQMTIHRSVYDSSRLDEALQEAQEKNQPLSFVLTDKSSTCGLCIRTSEAAFERLRRFSVVVYLPAIPSGDKTGVTPQTLQALHSPESGRYIPKVVTTSPDMFTVLGLVTYEEINENEMRALGAHRRKVEAIMSGQAPMPENKGSQRWYTSNTRFFTGTLMEVSEHHFKLKMEESGRIQTFDIKNFTPGTVRYLRHWATKNSGGDAAAPAQAGTPAVPEVWTSANNDQTLRGTFVKLEGDMLTLLDENGQTLRFNISFLNKESQDLARSKTP